MKIHIPFLTLILILFTYTSVSTADEGYLLASKDDGWLNWLYAKWDDDDHYDDEDDDEHDSHDDHHSKHERDDDYLTPVNNPVYREECGSCHFAYQPGLLPARSWQHLMSTLDNHFNDNAEVLDDVKKPLTDYLVKNAAENSPDEFSRKLMRRLSNTQTPLRITELAYFVHEHDDLSAKMVTDNPKVKSLSYCDKCHTRAEQGDYSEHAINIPGYGPWDD
jgi:hypothetical protein